MTLTDAQKATVRRAGGTNRLGKGEPCECRPVDLRTTKRRGFSDSMMWDHTCNHCGTEFTTWFEG